MRSNRVQPSFDLRATKNLAMMTRASIGDATLLLGDCRDILPSLGMVDVTITDPPYSAATHRGARTLRELGQSPIDFPHFTLEEFLSSARLLVGMTQRWVVMTCDFRHAGKLEECGLPLVRPGVWVKPNGAPQFSGDRPGMGFESVAILHRPGKKFWNGGGHHAVWIVPRTEGEHPAEKPLALVTEWVRLFSEPGETVLDPFYGKRHDRCCLLEARPEIHRHRNRRARTSSFPAGE